MFRACCCIRDPFQFAVPRILMVHFKVVCFVAKPLNRSEAKVDLVVIKT